MRGMRAFGGGVALSIVAGCSAHEEAAPPAPSSTIARPVALARLRESRPLAGVFAHAVPMLATSDAFVAGSRELRARWPRRASDPLRIEVSDSLWVELLPEQASDVEGVLVDGALTYADVAAETDVVALGGRGWTEEIRVLRGPSAAPTSRWHLRVGPAVVDVRAREGRLELLDANGVVALVANPGFAVDANGVTRPLTIELRDRTVTWSLDPKGLAYPIALDPSWTTKASMSVGRANHAAVALDATRMLVCGGRSDSTTPTLASCEIYDAAANTWSAAAPMALARESALMTRLSDGSVLVVGGSGGSGASVERYVPSTDSWSSAATPSFQGVALHPLPGARALLINGDGSVSETYDVAADAWSSAGSMTKPRIHGDSASGPGGTVVAAGGDLYGGATKSTEIFTVDKGWAAGPPMVNAHSYHAMTTLSDGRVLVVGGEAGAEIADVFDGTTWKQTPSRSMFKKYYGYLGPLPAPGALTITTGFGPPSYYDAASDQWISAEAPAVARTSATLVTLSSGKVVFAGGVVVGEGYVATIEVLAQGTNGSACVQQLDCQSFHCADGRCCSSACTGACQACDVAGSVGSCVAVASGAPHGSKTCGTFAKCISGACATTCAADADCVATSYCDASSACVAKKGLGSTCAAGRECGSTQCVDGVCCSSACAGSCQACNAMGVCASVSGPPVGARTCPGSLACSNGVCLTTCNPTGNDCDASSYCIGSSCVAKKANGVACTDRVQCKSGNCVEGVCCDTGCGEACRSCLATKKGSGGDGTCGVIADGTDPDKECPASTCSGTTQANAQVCNGTGACRANGTTPCAARYGCNDAKDACATSCAADDNCAAGSFCSAGACVAKLAEGTTCAGANQCASGYCVDAVCCESACGGTCAACSTAKKGSGANGKCEPVAADADPDSECKADDAFPVSCREDGACDGKGACRKYAKLGTGCGLTNCIDGKVTGRLCNGGGGCEVSTTACDPYTCDGASKACTTACTTDLDCAKSGFCNAASRCESRRSNGQSCAIAKECGSGYCADGVCCNAPCTGQCESCAEAGSEGSCTPVSGDPRGKREKCAGDPTVCGGRCNGGKGSECAYAPPLKSCGSGCSAGRETKSSCDGIGACVPGDERSCGAYACDGSTKCKTTCDTDANCASGYRCADGNCVPAGSAKCSDDLRASIGTDGKANSCGAYTCDSASGACKLICTVSTDCAASFMCNPTTKSCEGIVAPAAEGSGGCDVGGGHSPGRLAAGVLAACAIALRRRRRSLSTG